MDSPFQFSIGDDWVPLWIFSLQYLKVPLSTTWVTANLG